MDGSWAYDSEIGTSNNTPNIKTPRRYTNKLCLTPNDLPIPVREFCMDNRAKKNSVGIIITLHNIVIFSIACNLTDLFASKKTSIIQP
jgi:hypothetical protein